MLLLIDVGNTLIKWGVPVDGFVATDSAQRWHQAGSVARGEVALLAQAWNGLPVERVIVSNVAGPAMQDTLTTLLRAACGEQVRIEWFVSQPQLAGLRNHYKVPEQLGSDRFASAIGARALFPQRALIVATCGTATTVDAVTAGGDFIGGMILPGLGLMATSLTLNTAQLPQIQTMRTLASPFADNTVDAIVAGCVAAQVGAIERAVAAHAAQHGEVLCVLAGGAAPTVASGLAVPYKKVDNLVLVGLHAVA